MREKCRKETTILFFGFVSSTRIHPRS